MSEGVSLCHTKLIEVLSKAILYINTNFRLDKLNPEQKSGQALIFCN